MRKIFRIASWLCLMAGPVSAQVWFDNGSPDGFRVYQATEHYTLKQVRSTPFTVHGYSQLPSIDLDTAPASHEYLGCGISLTDASCYLLSQMPSSLRDSVIRDIFTPSGLNLSMVRLNCGASDYATELYNYDDTPGDVKMKHFSIDRDRHYMIPIIKEVRAVQPSLFIYSSIWSCPGWMKSSGAMCGGHLLEEYEEAFAAYWTAYLKAYQAEGVAIDAITVQNEPRTDQKGGCPATLIDGGQEARIAGKYLPRDFKKAGLKARIWVFDHNYNPMHLEHLTPLLSDRAVQKNAEAIAWHPYSGSVEFMDSIHKQYPMFDMHLTERGPNLTDRDSQTEFWFAKLIFEALNHGCKSYTGWNLVLDPDGQPNTGKFTCTGLISYDMETGKIELSRQYPVFKQFCPYVQRGAGILSISQPDQDMVCIVFRNPDGSKVVSIAYDGSLNERKRVQIKNGGKYLALCLPFGTWSLTTVVID